ncbi:MAG: SDR family oxidoreductase [Desertimonas sp.]
MNIETATALVTGANRGLGAAFCRALIERGATVHAGARDPTSVATDGVHPLRLDITDPGDVAHAAAACADVSLLINNAGTLTPGSLITDGTIDAGRRDIETNVFGTAAMSHAFAPVLAGNGGGVIVNVLSVLAWYANPASAIYCASKAAAWSLTNSLRQDLAGQGTQVVALHVGLMDTDMAGRLDAPKSSPDDIANLTLDAVEAGAVEVLADEPSRRVKAALCADVTALYPNLAG